MFAKFIQFEWFCYFFCNSKRQKSQDQRPTPSLHYGIKPLIGREIKLSVSGTQQISIPILKDDQFC